MEEQVLGFINYLRRAGLPISVSEAVDCFQALTHISIFNKDSFKLALSITLVKDSVHLPVFDELFNLYFFGAAAEKAKSLGLEPEELSPNLLEEKPENVEQFLTQLESALEAEDLNRLSLLADLAVNIPEGADQFTVIPGNLPGTGGSGLTAGEVLKQIDSLRQLRREEKTSGQIRTIEGLDGWLNPAEQQQMLEAFRNAVNNSLQRRELNNRGLTPLERRIPSVNIQETEINTANHTQLEEMERAVKPLAKKLASRIAHKRKHARKGKVDIRSTLRRSLDTGGVPIDIRFKYPRPTKPELYMLCDVSVSMTGFSAFALQLVYSIQNLFTKVRSFAFVDNTDEITEFFTTSDFSEALNRVTREAHVVAGDGRSDYGKALLEFYQKYSDRISSNSHIIILGDARNNRRPSQAWVLRELKSQVRKVYWLNPEPGNQWNTGDSIIDQYAKYCHGVYECTNIQQLSQVIPKLS
jgi:uncharacterized protein with von Willebrand factor type A (vWA) domain